MRLLFLWTLLLVLFAVVSAQETSDTGGAADAEASTDANADPSNVDAEGLSPIVEANGAPQPADGATSGSSAHSGAAAATPTVAPVAVASAAPGLGPLAPVVPGRLFASASATGSSDTETSVGFTSGSSYGGAIAGSGKTGKTVGSTPKPSPSTTPKPKSAASHAVIGLVPVLTTVSAAVAVATW